MAFVIMLHNPVVLRVNTMTAFADREPAHKDADPGTKALGAIAIGVEAIRIRKGR